MSKNEKKSETRQEQPAEQTARPMAAQPPNIEDRLAALEKANIELEQRTRKLERNCMASHGMR